MPSTELIRETGKAKRTGGPPTHPIKKETGKAKRTGGKPTHPIQTGKAKRTGGAPTHRLGKPGPKWNLTEIKVYVRKHKLNKPEIKLTMKKADLISGLKKHKHWSEKN